MPTYLIEGVGGVIKEEEEGKKRECVRKRKKKDIRNSYKKKYIP